MKEELQRDKATARQRIRTRLKKANPIAKLKRDINKLSIEVRGTKNDYALFKENSLQHRDILSGHLEKIDQRINTLSLKIEELGHQQALLERKASSAGNDQSSKATSPAIRLADDHALDDFYVQFENRYRGGEEIIKERQKMYLPYIQEALVDSKQSKIRQVLDIGCGRGEFLEILQENDFKAVGLDLNIAMVEIVEKKGLEGHQNDALSYLLEQKSQSLLAITGFQIVEHIAFDELIRIMTECYRTLVPGGIIIFETPNPENLVVAAHTFRYDPSHLNPIPPDLLAFVAESRGFEDIQTLRLHPIERKATDEATSPLLKELSSLVHGPRDYAIIAKRT